MRMENVDTVDDKKCMTFNSCGDSSKNYQPLSKCVDLKNVSDIDRVKICKSFSVHAFDNDYGCAKSGNETEKKIYVKDSVEDANCIANSTLLLSWPCYPRHAVSDTRHDVCSANKDCVTKPVDPVYKKLAQINGEVNRLKKKDLLQLLYDLHLPSSGAKDVLKKRLKNYYRKISLQSKLGIAMGERSQPFNYLVIIDFEATCQENNNEHTFQQEIIEFPAVLVDVQQVEIVGSFREFCKPTIHPVLSAFCTSLTGINQADVDCAKLFAAVLHNFHSWLMDKELGFMHSFCIVTDGPWDIKRFLVAQCTLSDVPLPTWANRWINLRKVYRNFYQSHISNLESMLVNLGLEFEGRQHCGMDDARNIARIVCTLIRDGCIMKPNDASSTFKDAPVSKISCLKDTGDGACNNECQMVRDNTDNTGTKRSKKSAKTLRQAANQTAHAALHEDVSDLFYYLSLQTS